MATEPKNKTKPPEILSLIVLLSIILGGLSTFIFNEMTRYFFIPDGFLGPVFFVVFYLFFSSIYHEIFIHLKIFNKES